ncbi:MAG: c-type cytochrome [Rhizomicrobium sp.]
MLAATGSHILGNDAGSIMRATLILVLAATLAMTGRLPAAEPPPELAKCQACHGKDGNSPSSEMPRLNGQPSLYLANRVRSFADATRQTPHATYFMMDVNSDVNDKTLAALAQYFAAQAPTVAIPVGALAEKGRKFYQAASNNLPACQSCHGAGGQGHDTIPRLNGQHAVYLRKQLQHFSMLTRVNDTMNPHIRNMTPEQIAALVAFLAKD